MLLTALGDAQIPVLALMLLFGSLTKLGRGAKARMFGAGLGPTSLFPGALRKPVGVALCGVEFALGAGLVLTAGESDSGRQPAVLVRVGTALLFVVATSALIELRNVRPDVGCGCFGEFSGTPVRTRSIVRAAALAVAAMASIWVHQIQLDPMRTSQIVAAGVVFALEIGAIAILSPETRDVLVRIGYSAPCEVRTYSADQTLAALARSAQWRKHRSMLASEQPSDVWRELCWRYVAYPSSHEARDAEIVFAVHLQHRRPAVLSALVDTATGAVLPWPDLAPQRIGLLRRRERRNPAAAYAPREVGDSAGDPLILS